MPHRSGRLLRGADARVQDGRARPLLRVPLRRAASHKGGVGRALAGRARAPGDVNFPQKGVALARRGLLYYSLRESRRSGGIGRRASLRC